MNKDRDIVLDAIQVEKTLLRHLDWFYRDECSDEIEHVIDICDRSPEGTFTEAWCNLEDQDIACLFIQIFNFDIRSMLMELVIRRRKEEKESAQEAIDRINDLRGLHG